MKFGVALQGVYPPREFMALVREIEELGFDELWLTDSSLHARNVYAYLTLAATVTTRLRIGSSVTNPLTRHPAIGAQAIATVDEISGGRTMYGIGVGDRPVQALGFRPAHLATLRNAVDATRRLLRGETVDMEDEAFKLHDAHLHFGARSDIPVYISASGPKTLELAGEIADGAIVLGGLFPEAMQYAISHIRKGETLSSSPTEVAVFAYGALNPDAAAAIEDARSIAAWFCQTAPAYCELAGMDPEIVSRVRTAYAGGEFQEAQSAASLIPDHFVQKLALAGTEEDGLRKAGMLQDLGADSVNVFPLGKDRPATIRAFAQGVIRRLR
jgi:5,10-methylenetetrahydromethanopterin reductase